MRYLHSFSNWIGRKANFDVMIFPWCLSFIVLLKLLYLTWNWIDRWLSGSALKQVAAFGCPDTNKSVVFPAKRLRKFFEVPENTVKHSMHERVSNLSVDKTYM